MAKQNKAKASVQQWNYDNKKMNERILNIHKSLRELDALLQKKGDSETGRSKKNKYIK